MRGLNRRPFVTIVILAGVCGCALANPPSYYTVDCAGTEFELTFKPYGPNEVFVDGVRVVVAERQSSLDIEFDQAGRTARLTKEAVRLSRTSADSDRNEGPAVRIYPPWSLQYLDSGDAPVV